MAACGCCAPGRASRRERRDQHAAPEGLAPGGSPPSPGCDSPGDLREPIRARLLDHLQGRLSVVDSLPELADLGVLGLNAHVDLLEPRLSRAAELWLAWSQRGEMQRARERRMAHLEVPGHSGGPAAGRRLRS